MRFFSCFGMRRLSLERLLFVFPPPGAFPASAAPLVCSFSGLAVRHAASAMPLVCSLRATDWRRCPLRVKPSVCSVLGVSAILRLSLRLSRPLVNQDRPIHSLVRRSSALNPGLALAALVPQFAERANPSFKRTCLRHAA